MERSGEEGNVSAHATPGTWHAEQAFVLCSQKLAGTSRERSVLQKGNTLGSAAHCSYRGHVCLVRLHQVETQAIVPPSQEAVISSEVYGRIATKKVTESSGLAYEEPAHSAKGLLKSWKGRGVCCSP